MRLIWWIFQNEIKNWHDITYSDITSFVASVPHSELPVPRPPAKDVDSESEDDIIKPEIEESSIGHTDKDNKILGWYINVDLQLLGWQVFPVKDDLCFFNDIDKNLFQDLGIGYELNDCHLFIDIFKYFCLFVVVVFCLYYLLVFFCFVCLFVCCLVVVVFLFFWGVSGLHIENQYQSIPIGHFVDIKETYETF